MDKSTLMMMNSHDQQSRAQSSGYLKERIDKGLNENSETKLQDKGVHEFSIA